MATRSTPKWKWKAACRPCWARWPELNMISGAGMLDFLACHSIEKLVIDAEAIASAQRLIRGIEPLTDSLATGMFAQTGLHGDFLKLKETRSLFRTEQHFPSDVIERGATAR